MKSSRQVFIAQTYTGNRQHACGEIIATPNYFLPHGNQKLFGFLLELIRTYHSELIKTMMQNKKFISREEHLKAVHKQAEMIIKVAIIPQHSVSKYIVLPLEPLD